MSGRSQQSVTIHDVAKRSGVSYQTVSRVINNHANVAAPTRERVLRSIEELNYRPSQLAKSLVTRRSQLIGVIAFGSGHYGPTQIIQNLQERAQDHGYEMLLTSLRDFAPQEIVEAMRRFQQFGVDGIVLVMPFDVRSIASQIDIRLPMIMIDAASDIERSTVSIDQFEGGVLATRHLVELGHQRILHLSGPVGSTGEWSDARLRLQGYQAVLEEARLPVLPGYQGDWSAQSGYAALQRALDDGVNPSAIFVANDQMALGVLSALKGRGFGVPHDISVVGFDDTPEAAYYDPPLTTVRQNFGLLGRRSLEELIRLIDTPGGRERHYVFESQLIVRETTASYVPSAP